VLAKASSLIQSSSLLKHLGIELNGGMVTKATGTAARTLFATLNMGRRVSAQKEFFIAAGRHLNQGLLMNVAF
jgi:hypothetical protein